MFNIKISTRKQKSDVLWKFISVIEPFDSKAGKITKMLKNTVYEL